MITVKTSEIWTADPPELIFMKLRWDTHQVKFGPANVFKKSNLRLPWIGEIDEERRTFKLFRVTSSDHTSDFAVHGTYEWRAGAPLVKIRHAVHYTSLFGLAGLLVFVYAIWFLIRAKKGIMLGEGYLLAGLLLAGLGYSFWILRDLNKNDVAIRELIGREVVPFESDHDDESPSDEEDET